MVRKAEWSFQQYYEFVCEKLGRDLTESESILIKEAKPWRLIREFAEKNVPAGSADHVKLAKNWTDRLKAAKERRLRAAEEDVRKKFERESRDTGAGDELGSEGLSNPTKPIHWVRAKFKEAFGLIELQGKLILELSGKIEKLEAHFQIIDIVNAGPVSFEVSPVAERSQTPHLGTQLPDAVAPEAVRERLPESPLEVKPKLRGVK